MERAILFVMMGFLTAALVAMIVADLQDDRKPEPAPADTEPPMLIPDGTTLRVVAWLPIAALLSAPVTFLEIWLIQRFEIDNPLLVIPVFAIIPILGVFCAMAARIRCPRCQLRLLLNRKQRPRFGERSKNRSAWGEMLYRIRKGRAFCCLFCGQRYHFVDPANV